MDTAITDNSGCAAGYFDVRAEEKGRARDGTRPQTHVVGVTNYSRRSVQYALAKLLTGFSHVIFLFRNRYCFL